MRADVPTPSPLRATGFVVAAAWRNGPLAFVLSLLEPLGNVLVSLTPLFVGLVVACLLVADLALSPQVSMRRMSLVRGGGSLRQAPRQRGARVGPPVQSCRAGCQRGDRARLGTGSSMPS